MKGPVFKLLLNGWLCLGLVVCSPVAKVIDLTHDISQNTPMSPGNPSYVRTLLHTGDLIPGVYVEYSKYSIGEHGGTHIDAPAHFDPDGMTLEKIPLENTILDAVVIDCSKETAKNVTYELPIRKLTEWEEEHGRIPDGGAILFNFNWSSRFPALETFYNTSTPNDTLSYRFPSISAEAANWMVTERNVMAIGIDTGSPDPMTSNYPVHSRLLKDKRIVVENVKDSGRLPVRGFTFHFSPVKFVGASGVQVRAYAITYEHKQNGGAPVVGWSVLTLGATMCLSIFSIIA